MPAVDTTGSPAARYSPIFVGEDEIFDGGRTKEIPMSAAAR